MQGAGIHRGRLAAGHSGDAVDAGGLKGLGEGHGGDDGGQAARQHEHIMNRTPASPLPSRRHRRAGMTRAVDEVAMAPNAANNPLPEEADSVCGLHPPGHDLGEGRMGGCTR
jgi:hypothetical protein